MEVLRLLIRSIRPRQWTKNLFVIPALIFSRQVFDPQAVIATCWVFLIFCAAGGAVYLFNDIRDIESDRHHPVKCKRPLASGLLSIPTAATAALFLTLTSMGGAWLVSRQLFWVVSVFLLMQVGYTLYMKHQVILDVFVLSLGFVARVVAGALSIQADISSWLILCTVLLALFLALSKRRHEITMLESGAANHRKVLAEYSPYLLDQMIAVVTPSTVVAYALYTLSEQTVAKFGTANLIFTVPFVIYGIFRYLYLVHCKNGGGRPEVLLLTDPPLLVNVSLWGLVAGLVVYF